MDPIRPNSNEVSTESVKSSEEKPKVANTEKGRSVQPVAIGNQLSVEKENEKIEKKILERTAISDQLNRALQEGDLNIAALERDGINREFIRKTSDKETVLNLSPVKEKQVSQSDESEFSETFVLSDMLYSQKTFNEYIEALDKKKNNLDLPKKELYTLTKKIGFLRHSYKIQMPYLLGQVLVRQLENKKIPLENVSDKVFRKELSYLLNDFKQRGIGISSKMQDLELRIKRDRAPGKQMQEKSSKRIRSYCDNIPKLKEFDTILDDYINSGLCPKWDASKPIYRGGDAILERKNIRNKEKEKPVFRKDLINRGGVVYGFGQYYTDETDYAEMYTDNKDNPVILTAYLKENIPIVKPSAIHKFHKTSSHDWKWSTFLDTIHPKVPVILTATVEFIDKKTRETREANVYTLSDPSIIDNMDLQASGNVLESGVKSLGELSMHRLDANYRIIGHPKTFKEIALPEESKIIDTGFIAYGHKEGESLPVLESEVDGVKCYVVKSPEDENVYWLVKQMPESLKKENPEFIVEPSSDFLLAYKEEKLELLHSKEKMIELEKKAEESRKAIRVLFDESCLDRIEEIEDEED